LTSDLLSAETMPLAGSRSSGSWLGRLARSTAFSWVISLVVHATVFWALYKVAYQQPAAPRRLIIPEAKLAPIGGPVTQGPIVPVKLSPQNPSPPINMAPAAPELPTIMADGSASIPASIRSEPGGSAASAATGGGSVASMGSVSAIGPSVGGPVSSFFGQAGSAYKVVYVVDVSASLMIYIDEIIKEMRGSIRDLLPTQRFHIVLAKPGEVQEFEPRRMVPAISGYKLQAMSFIDGISTVPNPGKADPVEAMRRAFAVSPELIYFLSDGDYPDVQDQLETTLAKLNAQQQVKITVIAFDPSPKPLALLERIAHNHGGHLRRVQAK
jgi:hypothetical protein